MAIESDDPNGLRGDQKAAIFLASLGVEHSSEVLKYVSEEHLERVMLALQLAYVLTNTGRLGDARDLARQAVREAEDTGDASLIAPALAVGVMMGFLLGDGLDRVGLDRALALEPGVGDRIPIVSRPTLIAGLIAYWTGDLEAAHADFVETRRHCLERGEESDLVVLTGKRNGQPIRQVIDLPDSFSPGKRATDPIIQNGDVIWVDRFPMVYVYGEVQRPGNFRLERGMSVMQALAAAGGPSLRGTDRGLRVHRRDASGKVQVLEPKLTDEVQDGDVLFIKESLF